MVDVLDPTSPIDGDAERITRYSRYYGSIVEAIQATTANLTSVIDTAYTGSESVAAFVDTAQKVRGRLLEVDERYEAVATQLALYAGHLRSFQEQAESIRQIARTAYSDHDHTVALVADLRARIDAADPADPSLPAVRYNLTQQEGHLHWIESARATANTELEQVLAQWSAVADSIADAIDAGVDGSSLNDSRWDQLLDFLESMVTTVLPLLEEWLDKLALVLTVAAFVLAAVGVGAPLAAAFLAVARVAQVVSKIVTTVRITWTAVLVINGKMPASSLSDAAVALAAGSLGPKVSKVLGDGALNLASRTKAARSLSTAAQEPGSTFVVQHLDRMVNDGFDAWAHSDYVDYINVGAPGGSLADSASDFTGNAWGMTSWAFDPVGALTDSLHGDPPQPPHLDDLIAAGR